MKYFGLLLAIVTASLTHTGQAATPAHLVIDPSDKYTTTFVAIAQETSASGLKKIHAAIKQRSGAQLVLWSDFRREPRKYVRQHIRRDDYPEVDVVDGLAALLERYSNKPFGLTWNGGLAVTSSDYQHAARTFAAYQKNADQVAKRDRRSDPVHPANHLDALLGK